MELARSAPLKRSSRLLVPLPLLSLPLLSPPLLSKLSVGLILPVLLLPSRLSLLMGFKPLGGAPSFLNLGSFKALVTISFLKNLESFMSKTL